MGRVCFGRCSEILSWASDGPTFQQRPPGNVCGCVGMCYVYAICVWHMCPCVLSHTNLRNGNGVYSWRSVLGASNTEYMVEDSSPDSLLVGLPLTLIH